METVQTTQQVFSAVQSIYSVQVRTASSRGASRILREIRPWFHKSRDPAVAAEGKETPAALGATVSVRAEPRPEPLQRRPLHALLGDALEVEVAATGAMGVVDKSGRNFPRIETRFADFAAPGAQAKESSPSIAQAATV